MLLNTQYSSDDELFSSIKTGDIKAFEIFFLRYYSVLCAYSHHFLEHIEDGEEIVQDLMVWFWENRDMHIIESSPRNYLYKAVKNRCLTLLNRKQIKERIIRTMANNIYHLEDPDFYIVDELVQKIEEAISNLPETYREAFKLNRFDNMSYKEIATKYNVSVKTIDYRIGQALKILRIELKDYLPLLIYFFNISSKQ